MGHLNADAKKTYRKLGQKIDRLTMKAPWNNTFYELLTDLYTAEEAEVIVNMPYSLATIAKSRNVSRCLMLK